MNVQKTSQMMYPLEEPNGWFMCAAGHRHQLEGSHYVPEQLSGGNWWVTFQRTVTPTCSVSGTGHTLEEAWATASAQIRVYDKSGRADG